MLHKSAWGGIYSISFFFQLGERNLTTVLGPKLALFGLQGEINQATTLNVMERLNLLGCSQLPPSSLPTAVVSGGLRHREVLG